MLETRKSNTLKFAALALSDPVVYAYVPTGVVNVVVPVTYESCTPSTPIVIAPPLKLNCTNTHLFNAMYCDPIACFRAPSFQYTVAYPPFVTPTVHAKPVVVFA